MIHRPQHILGADQLGRFIEVVARKGYQVIGPTLRDGAIVYSEVHSLEDLPQGWTDEQKHDRLQNFAVLENWTTGGRTKSVGLQRMVLSNLLEYHGVTVKLPELRAVPPAVTIAMFPVFAPVGTVVVTCVSVSTVKVVAFTPPKATPFV